MYLYVYIYFLLYFSEALPHLAADCSRFEKKKKCYLNKMYTSDKYQTYALLFNASFTIMTSVGVYVCARVCVRVCTCVCACVCARVCVVNVPPTAEFISEWISS